MLIVRDEVDELSGVEALVMANFQAVDLEDMSQSR